ncbi:MAG TPA: hypothetical protein VMZ06_16150, partial [Candidatus Bathyarchaeia archaeon]|nr:hypothetical protein [Candidatus Bathyarchaeia archaeon]
NKRFRGVLGFPVHSFSHLHEPMNAETAVRFLLGFPVHSFSHLHVDDDSLDVPATLALDSLFILSVISTAGDLTP